MHDFFFLQLGSDKHLPSPLCPKEYHMEYRMDLLPVFDEEDEDCNPEDDTDNQLAADISSFVSILHLGRKFSLLFVHGVKHKFSKFSNTHKKNNYSVFCLPLNEAQGKSFC